MFHIRHIIVPKSKLNHVPSFRDFRQTHRGEIFLDKSQWKRHVDHVVGVSRWWIAWASKTHLEELFKLLASLQLNQKVNIPLNRFSEVFARVSHQVRFHKHGSTSMFYVIFCRDRVCSFSCDVGVLTFGPKTK